MAHGHPPRPTPPIDEVIPGRGEFEGMTAGNGKEGAGDAERRIEGEEPNDDRRRGEVGGGFIGKRL